MDVMNAMMVTLINDISDSLLHQTEWRPNGDSCDVCAVQENHCI